MKELPEISCEDASIVSLSFMAHSRGEACKRALVDRRRQDGEVHSRQDGRAECLALTASPAAFFEDGLGVF
jgi:hypothetical protein